MIITNLLHEDNSSSLFPNLPISQIQQDCSEYLSNPAMLLRGVSSNEAGQYVANPTIRKDRRSLSGRYVGTAIFNEAFEVEFGFPKVRNQCLFVTNDSDIAHKYGEPYFILPTNGSKIASKEGVGDSISIVGNSWYDFTDTLKDHMTKEEKNAFVKAGIDMNLNTPNIPENWFDQLLNTLSEATQDLAHHIMTKIQERMMNAYVVEDVNSIRGSSFPIEYMLFNADQYWMIHAESICNSVQISNYQGAWDAFIKNLEK